MDKLPYDIILVGFQTNEFEKYNYTQRKIDSLSFDKAIKKLKELNVWFKVFYKNENTYWDLEDFQEKYYYWILIENKEDFCE